MKRIKLSKVIALFLSFLCSSNDISASCCYSSSVVDVGIPERRLPTHRLIVVAPKSDEAVDAVSLEEMALTGPSSLSTKFKTSEDEDPIAASSVSEVIPPPPASRVPQKALIVDDQSVRMLKSFLTSLGFEVTVLTSGQEAIDSFNSANIFDLVFMDYNMPRMTGLQTTQSIRTMHPELDIPFVLYSTEDGVTREEAMTAKFTNSKSEIHRLFNAELPKPWTKSQLITLLKSLKKL